MSLNIGVGSSRPFIKFNSKVGRWFIRGEAGDEEIDNPTLVFDFENIETLWMLLREDAQPERQYDAVPGKVSPKPGPDYKHGFMMMVFLDGHGALEFSSPSKNVGVAVDELHTAWEDLRKKHKGRLPVVECPG